MSNKLKPTSTCLELTATVDEFIAALKFNGCEIRRDKDARTVEAFDDGVTVFRAIQKGNRQTWIVSFYETDRIKWKHQQP